jgi:hypothetical protein
MQEQKVQALPKSRLVSVVQLIEWFAQKSDNAASVQEVADAIGKLYDGDSMALFDGSGYGLAEPIGSDRLGDEIGYNYRVDTVSDLFNSRFWINPNANIRHLNARDILVRVEDAQSLAQSLWFFFFPGTGFSFDLDQVRELHSSGGATESVTQCSADESLAIVEGPTHARLMRAIASFPVRYPGYQDKPPKLDDDVRPWLSESGLAMNDAERRVFGAIIREHFKL